MIRVAHPEEFLTTMTKGALFLNNCLRMPYNRPKSQRSSRSKSQNLG